MIFKSFTHISRHAALAKSLWVTSGNSSSQPAFFAKTNHLARQQSQLVPRNNSSLGSSDRSSSNSVNPNGYSSLCNSSAFSTLSPLSTLDDDKRREAILAESTGSSGSCLIYNHQHSLSAKTSVASDSFTRRRRCSTSSLDNEPIFEASIGRRRRYSVSRAELPSHLVTTDTKHPQTPPSSPTAGPINDSNLLIEAELDLFKLDNGPADISATLAVKSPEYLAQTPYAPAYSQNFPQMSTGSHPRSISEETDTQSFTSPTYSASTQTSFGSEIADLHISNDRTKTKSIDIHHDIQHILTSQLAQSINSASIPSVVASYQLLQTNNVPISTDVYENILSFLSSNILKDNSAQNLTNILSIYMDMASKRLPPTNKIYSAVISSLIALAEYTVQHKEKSLAYYRLPQRHRKSALASILASQRKGDSSASLYKAALDIFDASNSVKPQKYTTKIYNNIINGLVSPGSSPMLYSITRMLEINNCTLTADILISLIKGYGRHGDVKAAVESYKHYKALSGSLVDRKEYEVYAALIGAYFDTGSPESGLIFLNKVLETSPKPMALELLISEVIEGYCRIGDYRSAVAWIERHENNPKYPSVNAKSLAVLLSASSDAGDIQTCKSLFDSLSSNKNLPASELDVSRSDFIALCVKCGNTDLLLGAIKESQLRGGVWDLSTVLFAVKYLVQAGQISLALETFQLQGHRYLEYLRESSLEANGQTVDAVNTLVKELQVSNNLNVNTALTLMESDLFDAQVFSDVNGGGISCIKAIWDAQTDGTLDVILSDSPYSIVNIVNTHLKWIQASGANNSLGGLAIPTPLLNSLKSHFSGLIQSLITISPALESSFKDDISYALDVLGAEDTAVVWSSFCDRILTRVVVPADFAPIAWDLNATKEISVAAETSLSEAMDLFNASMSRGDIVKSDAYVSLIEAATLAKDEQLIKDIYKTALSTLPHPSEHPDALDAWVPLHQAVVRSANVAYNIANAAYDHLTSLGAYPDATGYGQLISNAPSSSSHDEAADAIWMLKEAKTNHVVLNTFLYNVVLSKLARARRLKEAISIFKEMGATFTKKNSVTYGTMINACCRSGDEGSAKALFDEMEAAPGYTPKIAPFNIMLQFYVHSKGDRKSALQMYNRLRALDIKPSSHTYKLLMDAYSTIEPIDILAADRVLVQIVADNTAITTKHYASLIFARGVCMKNEQAALDFYKALINSAQVRPDKHIFQALLESYVVNNKVRSASVVLKDMVTFGVDLDAYMANILIRGWAPVNLEKARGLFDHVLQEGIAEPSSFESIILAYLLYGNTHEAYEILNLMAAQLFPEPVIAKVQTLIQAHSSLATRPTEGDLLGSIFRQDSHVLNGSATTTSST